MDNIFRQAKHLIDTKTCGEFTPEERKLIAEALSPAIYLAPKAFPQFDSLPLSKVLEELAKIVDGATG